MKREKRRKKVVISTSGAAVLCERVLVTGFVGGKKGSS